MNTYFIVILFLAVVLIFLVVFRRKFYYWNSPISIIDWTVKKWAGSVHFFSSIMLAACLHIGLNNLFYIDRILDDSPFSRVVCIAGEFGVFIIPVGILIDQYIASTNPQFKKWRKSKMPS